MCRVVTIKRPNVKKAKFFLAKAAIMGLYQVESLFEAPV